MKAIIKSYVLNLIILWIIAGLFKEVQYATFYNLCLAALILSLLQILIKPIITLLFMPIQLLTLGLLKWVPQFITLFIFRAINPGYTIGNITLPSVSLGSITTPSFHLGSLTSLLFFALCFYYLNKFIQWILK